MVDGPRAGETIEVGGALTIGRHAADVVLDDERLSRLHLKLTPDGDSLLVEDLGSTNGTIVDDRRIDAPTHAGDGSRVCFGESIAEVVVVAEAPSATLADPSATRVADSLTVVEPEPATQPIAATLEPAEGLAAEPVAEAPARLRSEPVAPDVLVGIFNPPAVRHSRGLATRSWVPVALSYGTAILTAIALVIYFAQR